MKSISKSKMSKHKNLLTVRNLRPFTPILQSEIESKWTQLEDEIVTILKNPSYGKSLEELYRLAEELYSKKYTTLLFNLQLVFETYLNEKLHHFRSLDDSEEMLPKIDEFWKEFCAHIRTIKNVFLFYDRSPKFFKYNTVHSISMGLFSSVIVLNPTLKHRLIGEILKEINNQRNSFTIDKQLLKSAIEMLNTLQIYDDIFLGDFLKSSRTFYEQLGSKFIHTLEVPSYLLLVQERIGEEQERIKSYLNKATENVLLDIVYKELVENHMITILDRGLDQLIESKMHQELALIFKLFNKTTNGGKNLLQSFQNFIARKGLVKSEASNEKNMIQDLIDFKDHLEQIISIAFDNEKVFHESLRSSFKNFLNNSNAKTAQLLAKYIDSILRSKDIADEDTEVILSKTIKLFKYVQGKDIFEAFYKKLLAKRLLLGKSANQDAEHSMITKLKEECGSGFTSNIEGMFQDINLSKTINASFRQRVNTPDFSVYILTSSYWPNYPNYEINLPTELISYQLNFQKYYLANHSGRKLLWQPNLGHCLVKASFACGYKELQVSLFQTIVLLLFNNLDEMSFKEIQESTNLERMELTRTVLSLACGKSRVLCKTPKKRDVTDEDVFSFNDAFTDKLFRVRINQVQLQESAEDERQTEKNVLVDRQFQIDAAIVRIMKQHKRIKHAQLVKELYTVLEIPVNQTDLKKRIEQLIEREYMERDKENKSDYIYIA